MYIIYVNNVFLQRHSVSALATLSSLQGCESLRNCKSCLGHDWIVHGEP